MFTGMECKRRALSLVVLTLLQLCRAEIKEAQPQWYSANIINDGFQIKPISEIFSTGPTFSTANPIIVSSKNIDNTLMQSTLAPPTSLSSSTTFKASTTAFPPSSQFNSMSSFPPNTLLPQYSSSPPQIQRQTLPADLGPIQAVQPLLRIFSELQPQPQRNVQIQEQSTPSLPHDLLMTTFNQQLPTESTLPQDLRFKLISQDDQSSIGPDSSTTHMSQNTPQQSNYFVIYQQPPQQIQSNTSPFSSPRTDVREEFFSTTMAPPVSSTLSSTFSSPSPTFSTISSSSPSSILTSPLFFPTTRPPTTQYLSSTSPRVEVTSLSSIGSSSSVGSSGTRFTNCMVTTTPLPGFNSGKRLPLQVDKLFPMKIRVMAPSGSITNVNFNPPAKPAVLTLKPVVHKTPRTTTTRKPTTRRTSKPKKNTYERCLQGCRKNGHPLCAAPLSQYPLDPKYFKGFPSVCHMACHNSYRKDAFEKVIDGSCSKLRTRIRPVDSDSKLKHEELHKVQYFVDNSGQQQVIEISGAYS